MKEKTFQKLNPWDFTVAVVLTDKVPHRNYSKNSDVEISPVPILI